MQRDSEAHFSNLQTKKQSEKFEREFEREAETTNRTLFLNTNEKNNTPF